MADAPHAYTTSVNPSRSLKHVRREVERYGGKELNVALSDDRALVRFRVDDRWVQFEVCRPESESEVPDGVTGKGSRSALEQEWWRRWRVLLMRITTAFETMAAGETAQLAFLPYVMLPGGETVGDAAERQLPAVYAGELDPGQFDLTRPTLTTGEDR